MDNKITMDGKYAYRKDPFTQVRILCVDRPVSDLTVVSMNFEGGGLTTHNAKGESPSNDNYDLVPLQDKLPDLWINLYDNGSRATHLSKESALSGALNTYGERYDGIKTIKYIPAPDQTS